MAATVPGAPYAAPPRTLSHASVLPQPPKLIVVHCTANTASKEGEAKYAATRTDDVSHWTSCHLYVDETGVLGSLPLDRQAWAAYGWANARSWQIEMCGRENAVPEATQRRAAALVRQLCLLGGVPMVHLDGLALRALHAGQRATGGVTGHGDITVADFDGNTHTDPGDRFDWARFMSWVTEGDTVAGEADAAFSKPYTETSTWVSPQSWVAKAVEKPLEALAEDVAEVKAGLAALQRPQFTDAQVADMADRLRANLRAAIEDALRDVLGSVDGATPTT